LGGHGSESSTKPIKSLVFKIGVTWLDHVM
jgi:hypothetical protein